MNEFVAEETFRLGEYKLITEKNTVYNNENYYSFFSNYVYINYVFTLG